MVINFSMNNTRDLINLKLNKNFEVISNEVKNPRMCEVVFKHGIPYDTESLKNFFHNYMGDNDEIPDYIDFIKKHGFYNPYERNLRIQIWEGEEYDWAGDKPGRVYRNT